MVCLKMTCADVVAAAVSAADADRQGGGIDHPKLLPRLVIATRLLPLFHSLFTLQLAMFATALPASGRAHAARLARAFRQPSKPLPFFTPASTPRLPSASSSFFSSATRSTSSTARQAPSTRSAAGLAGLRLSLRTIAPGSLRSLHSSGRVGAQLGRIRPKRVAVIDGEIVDGLPKPSIWRPIVVSSTDADCWRRRECG